MTDREHRDDDPHDNLIPGPTDDTYKDSDRSARSDGSETPADDDDAPGTGREGGREPADGERRFDYS